MMDSPTWLRTARTYLGVTETHGPRTTPTIGKWLANLKAWWRDDETPWCGTFVAAVMQEVGITPPPAWYRAKAWAAWGESCGFRLGAVAVFERPGGGHVGFVTAVDHARNMVQVLGGNQGDKVSFAWLSVSRLIALRWPANEPREPVYDAPATAAGAASTNEA